MAASSDPVITSDSRKDPSASAAMDDSSLPGVDNPDKKPAEACAKKAETSAKASKTSKVNGRKANKHIKNKTTKKARFVPDSDSESEKQEEGKDEATTSESDATDSDSDVEPVQPKKHPKDNYTNGTQRKKSASRKNKSRQLVSESDSDSESAPDGENDHDKSNRRTGDDRLKKHMQNLQLQVSQLQNQLSLAQLGSNPQLFAPVMAPLGGNTGYGTMPPAMASVMPPAMHPGAARIIAPPQPPINHGRPGLARPGRLGMARLVPELLLGGTDTTSSEGDVPPPTDAQKKGQGKSNGVPQFKRVDWVWDSNLYAYKLQDTNETADNSQYNGYIFHVRRAFDAEGKHRHTFVDIKSKLLRECLQDVIGNVKGISLVDETPKLDPNVLFMYLEDFTAHLKHLKHLKPAGDSKKELKKNQKRLDNKRSHLKVLVKYLNKDYAKIKSSLYPMLASGLITFDLLWALWKPGTLGYASTYGSQDVPRAFKVEVAERHSCIMKGEYFSVEGKYTEFDGKRFGYGNYFDELSEFKGARKITSLPCYPLKYHTDEAHIRKILIERGKQFVTLSGVHYKSFSGLAFFKRRKNQVIKFNVQPSRIMIDPTIFRRLNPNYIISSVRPKDHDILSEDEMSDDDMEQCDCNSDGSGNDEVQKLRYVTKVVKDDKGNVHLIRRIKDESDSETEEKLEALAGVKKPEGENGEAKLTNGESKLEEEDEESLQELTDEDFLIASPVLLGFSFSEKQWLEFPVSGVSEIKWNDKAWDSLVLEPQTKDLIQALVQSRKYHAAQTIDDVIQGKGKGLVTVLHGPPGTGKTLTAEGISELLKCPLYMASAGELGTDSRFLEAELQKILDVCHAWGAILLLDEADVFLEKRNMHDLHRNALVSIFLRQLEYFQGILFLTTNRVETFDEAFQSRIHIALKYESLDSKAKKAIFKMFLDRVQKLGKLEMETFSEQDLIDLAKRDLNGREIKNVVSSAQDLAVNRKEAFGMKHIRQVLEVHDKFGRDLKGGTGYEDAMRSYF